MEDTLISFETAKLAKEKGFNIYQDIQYSQEVIDKTITYNYTESQCRLFGDVYYAPTQSLLQRWLREVHNIIIYVKPGFDNLEKEEEYYWNIKIRNKTFIKDGGFKTYEEALEKGLQKALKSITLIK